MPDVAGMLSVTSRLLSLPSGILDPNFVKQVSDLKQKTPNIPTSADGQYLLAGEKLPPSPGNSENAELYAVHPYRLFTSATSAKLDIAINSYKRRQFKCNDGWCQDIMVAALLGQTSEAMSQVVSRANTKPEPGYRFPGFMPHFQDFAPSGDHLSNMNSALQWMLLQPADNGTIFLLPAWPCGQWSVDFKLQAPKQTTIEGTIVNSKLSNLKVTPPSRRSDVIILGCN